MHDEQWSLEEALRSAFSQPRMEFAHVRAGTLSACTGTEGPLRMQRVHRPLLAGVLRPGQSFVEHG